MLRNRPHPKSNDAYVAPLSIPPPQPHHEPICPQHLHLLLTDRRLLLLCGTGEDADGGGGGDLSAASCPVAKNNINEGKARRRTPCVCFVYSFRVNNCERKNRIPGVFMFEKNQIWKMPKI